MYVLEWNKDVGQDYFCEYVTWEYNCTEICALWYHFTSVEIEKTLCILGPVTK